MIRPLIRALGRKPIPGLPDDPDTLRKERDQAEARAADLEEKLEEETRRHTKCALDLADTRHALRKTRTRLAAAEQTQLDRALRDIPAPRNLREELLRANERADELARRLEAAEGHARV